MMKSIAILLSIILCTSAYAGDYLTGFDTDKDLPILNEHLRKIDQALLYGRGRSSSTDDTLGYLDETLEDLALTSIRGWGQDMTFSATDNDTVAWTSGTITMSDGTNTYSISAGNTGDITALTYIYLDTDTSSTVLQTTTTSSESVGDNKILIAISEDVADVTKYATYQVFGGAGGVGGTLITADNIATSTLTANEIVANTITASEIAASTITATEMNVSQLSAISANLGTVTAGSISGLTGTIGGWTLAETGFSGGSGEDYIGLIPGTGIQMGNETFGDAEFSVTVGGVLKATSGTIGGWDLTTDTIESASNNIVMTDSTSEITVGATGSTHLQIDGANVHIQTSDFVSGALGKGWQIAPRWAEFQNVYARGILRSTIFEYETISAMGGTFLISHDADKLNADMGANDTDTAMVTEGNVTFAVGDFLRIKALSATGVDDEWMEVATATDAENYVVVRDKAGDYADGSNPEWTTGAAIVNFGQSADGGILMTASENNSPHIDVYTIDATPWNSGIDTRMRMGNLNGFLGYSTDLYGIAIGESDAYLKYDPTNGLQIKGVITVTGGNAVQTFVQDDIPTSIAIGDMWVDTNDSDKLYMAYSAGADQITAGEWVEVEGGGVATYRQSGIPTATSAGDLWIDSDDNKLYRATAEGDDQIGSGEWIESQDDDIATAQSAADDAQTDADTGISDAADAQTTATAKSKVFRQSAVPTAVSVGDLFIDTDDYKLYRATNIGDDAVTAGEWELYDAGQATGWSHASDVTKIDGGDIYTGTVTADKITAGTFVGGDFVIADGGAFKSDNYVADTTGVKLDHTGLELNDGTTVAGEGILETIMIYSMLFGGE